MRKLIRFTMLLAALMLTACSGIKPAETTAFPAPFPTPVYNWATAPQSPIVVWTREHDLDRIYMQRAFARYEELTGNTVEVVTFPQETFEADVQNAFLGNGPQPDVLLNYGGTNIEPFYPDENFYDFSDAPWVKDLTASSINQTIYHGKVVGLPHWESSVSGTLYNKELFERYNIKVPENQAEFMAACQALKDNGVIPLYLPYQVTSMMLYQFPMDSILEDSALLSGLNDGSLSYSDIPEMKTIVEWYRTMAEKGYLGQSYQENDWDGMDEAMASGRYGMMLCWDTWLYTDFSGNAADFGLMPAFLGVPEEGTFEGPNQALLIVNRHSKNLDAALNFITFLADPYNYNVAFEGIYTAPAFKNQFASVTTPQYVAAERIIEDKFRDSITWLRVRGFSQMDASCIQKYMTSQPGYSVEACLREMDLLREARIANMSSGE